MSARRKRGGVLSALVAALVMLWPPADTHADTDSDVEYVAGVIDTINSAAAGQLPFTGQDLRDYKDILKSCGKSGSADDVVACIQGASATPAGQEELPSWFPKMLNIYFDIRKNDFWGLLEDTSYTVACAAATILTDGVDICGGIKALVDAAGAVWSEAKAIVKFFADLGSDIAGGAKGVYCYFFGCDDSAPAVPPEAVAYQNFFFPRLAEGLTHRLAGPANWQAYAGPTNSAANPQVIDQGLAAGYALGALNKALPAFRAAVYVQWDVKIVTELAPAVRQAGENWSDPNWVNKYVAQAEVNWDDGELAKALDDPYLGQSGHADCVAALTLAGGPQVDAWVNEGQAQQPKFAGFKWPKTFVDFCKPFDTLFNQKFGPFVQAHALEYWSAHCNHPLESTAYCDSEGAAKACQAANPKLYCFDKSGHWTNPKGPSGPIAQPPCADGQSVGYCKCDGYVEGKTCHVCGFKDPHPECQSESNPCSSGQKWSATSQSCVPIDEAVGPHALGPVKPPHCKSDMHWNGTSCVSNIETSHPALTPATPSRRLPSLGIAPMQRRIQTSTLCRFTKGPRRGQTQDYAPMQPLPVGSPCQDGRGSSGTVVAR